MSAQAKDLSGFAFGRWTVIQRQGTSKHGAPLWLCRCQCGTERPVVSAVLVKGDSQSCGCLRLELARVRAKTHGLTKSREYRSWESMRQRCANPNHDAFHNYGGRGISVCDRWSSFETFLSDMGPRPDGSTLDRIDVNGGYSPENCRWASESEQKNNRRDNRYLEWEGQRYTISELARLFGKSYNVVNKRLKAGYTLERALHQRLKGT